MRVIRRDDNNETVRARRAATAPTAARLFDGTVPTNEEALKAGQKASELERAKLIPADSKRCQTEWNEYYPFIMGGNVNQTVRCDKVPSVIVTEGVPGDDGQCGSMSMCSEHLEIFKKKHPKIAATVSITPI